MTVCLLIAAILGIASIFCFFGTAFSFTDETWTSLWVAMFGRVPSMFDFSFGVDGWNWFVAITCLFGLAIFIIIVSVVIINYIIYKYRYNVSKNIGYVLSGILGVSSLTAMIMSFCTLLIIFGSDLKEFSDFMNLGLGPILYGSFQALIIVVLIIGVIYQITKRPRKLTAHVNTINKAVMPTVNENTKYCIYCGKSILDEYKVCPYCGKSVVENKPIEIDDFSDQKNKIQLLNEYHDLYSKSIISEDDFNKIKEKILNDN